MDFPPWQKKKKVLFVRLLLISLLVAVTVFHKKPHRYCQRAFSLIQTICYILAEWEVRVHEMSLKVSRLVAPSGWPCLHIVADGVQTDDFRGEDKSLSCHKQHAVPQLVTTLFHLLSEIVWSGKKAILPIAWNNCRIYCFFINELLHSYHHK